MLGVDMDGVDLVVFIDYYSHWVEAFPFCTTTAETVSRVFVKEILTLCGVLDYNLSDRGSQIVSELFQIVCHQWVCTEHCHT